MEIKIRELCKSYGKKKALQNFDATFENGIYGILGPNGAGKSTLMNILTDNLLRDSGRILCGGKDMGRGLQKIARIYATAATVVRNVYSD